MNQETLDVMVSAILSEHPGGESFFNCLDEKLASIHYFDWIHLKVSEFVRAVQETHGVDCRYICSGAFGSLFMGYLNMIGETEIRGYHVRGGLRKETSLPPLMLTAFEDDLIGKICIFVDDSFYSGRTRDKIKLAVESCEAILGATIVLYDGAAKVDESVFSLTRFYDENGKKRF